MVFSCFAVYVLANNTRVVRYFYCRVHSKYRTTCVLFASTYTAKQLKTIYYSLTKIPFQTSFNDPVSIHVSKLGFWDERKERTWTILLSSCPVHMFKSIQLIVIQACMRSIFLESRGLYFSSFSLNWRIAKLRATVIKCIALNKLLANWTKRWIYLLCIMSV